MKWVKTPTARKVAESVAAFAHRQNPKVVIKSAIEDCIAGKLTVAAPWWCRRPSLPPYPEMKKPWVPWEYAIEWLAILENGKITIVSPDGCVPITDSYYSKYEWYPVGITHLPE